MRIDIPLTDNPPTVTAQQKGECIEYTWRNGRQVPYIKHYEKPEIVNARKFYTVSILKALKASGQKLPKFDGPVEIAIAFVFKAPRKKDHGQPKPTKPDIDNMCKLLFDVLGDELNMFTVGDQQITRLTATKLYATQPGIYIEIHSHITTSSEAQP